MGAPLVKWVQRIAARWWQVSTHDKVPLPTGTNCTETATTEGQIKTQCKDEIASGGQKREKAWQSWMSDKTVKEKMLRTMKNNEERHQWANESSGKGTVDEGCVWTTSGPDGRHSSQGFKCSETQSCHVLSALGYFSPIILQGRFLISHTHKKKHPWECKPWER